MRDRILAKAEELFMRYGIKRITMDDIATALGISKKTIYQSFADKTELISEIFNRHIKHSEQNCVEDFKKADNAIHEVMLGTETFCTTMQSMNASILYDLEKYHPETFKRFIEFKNSFIYNLILQNLKRGIEEELYRSDMNADIIAKMRLANILISANIELFPVNKFRLPDVENEIITHFLYGIVTAKGAKITKKYISRLPLAKDNCVLN